MNHYIPIYRAKKLDSEEYVEGFINKAFDHTDENGDLLEQPIIRYFLMSCMDNESSDIDMWDFYGFEEIDPTTLAIHFPDMIDSQGNKIFASLQRDGKGGDKTDYGKVMIFDSIETIPYFESWSNYTVTEIKE